MLSCWIDLSIIFKSWITVRLPCLLYLKIYLWNLLSVKFYLNNVLWIWNEVITFLKKLYFLVASCVANRVLFCEWLLWFKTEGHMSWILFNEILCSANTEDLCRRVTWFYYRNLKYSCPTSLIHCESSHTNI